MNIGVEATCWHNVRGYGRHLRSLMSAMARVDRFNRYTLVSDREISTADLPAGFELRVTGPPGPLYGRRDAGRRALQDMWRISRALSSRDFDLVMFPTVYSYVPVTGRAARVILIHDVIAETFPDLTVPGRMARSAWNLKVTLARLQADAVVTVSDYSRRLLLQRFGLNGNQVFVAGEASDPVFRRLPAAVPGERLREFGLDTGQTVVYVGGFGPHKNIEGLVRAFSRLPAAAPYATSRLVLVGDYDRDVFHSNYGRIRTLVATLELQERVVFTGFLEDEDLVQLLNRATVLVLPSLMEGFGLPAMEAAACECPVIATRESPLPELLGDGGIFIEPTEGAIEAALRTVLSSPERCAAMREAGVRAASRLSWEQGAEQLLGVFQAVMGQRRMA